jgi:hypothetical protein
MCVCVCVCVCILQVVRFGILFMPNLFLNKLLIILFS